jgi:hypothetical protein
MTLRVQRLLPVLVASLLVALLAAAPAARGDVAWTVVPSPSPVDDGNFLYGLAADGTADAWAVGEQYPGSGALIEHWDGSAWSLSNSPDFAVDKQLNGVAADSPQDAWAVGQYYDAAGSRQAVIEHWDGSAWALAPTPNPGTDDTLAAVAVVSAGDAWAVGHAASSTADAPALIEHWNGSNWQVFPSPAVAYPSYLRAITAISANDIWAVGTAGQRTLTEHWNGSAWSVVKSPSPSTSTHYAEPINVLNGVTAISADNVWAVGTFNTTQATGAADHTLVEHWNGTKWSLVDSPDTVSGYTSVNHLQSVAAISASDVWAVGVSKAATYGAADQTLIEHWDGTAWTIAPSPVTTTWSALYAITAIPDGGLWAAGADAQNVTYEENPVSAQTLILTR